MGTLVKALVRSDRTVAPPKILRKKEPSDDNFSHQVAMRDSFAGDVCGVSDFGWARFSRTGMLEQFLNYF